MAGIGFVLRKLASEDNFSGIIRAYFHSAIVAVGPWILIIVSLGFVTFFTSNIVGLNEQNEFLAVVIYNFFFSFIFSAPLYLLSARYVADCLYLRDVNPIPGIFITSLLFLIVPAMVLAVLFYTFYATMSVFTIISSVINFSLLAQIWIVMLYLGSIRNFRAITLSWVLGSILTIVCAVSLGNIYGAIGLLNGLNIGLVILLYSLKAQILAEYPFVFRKPKEFSFYFTHYKGLFWSGFFLFAGMWIDKAIMWTAPEAVTHLNNLRTYPVYDGGMFFSYLSIIPVMALFIFSLETNFYDSYIQYIHHIERNAPLSLIEEEKKNILKKVLENGRIFIVLQGSITLVIIGMAPTILEWMKVDFLQLGIFRLGALGAFFGALNLFIVIFLSYFDSQSNMLKVTGIMLGSNAIFTLITESMGFSYYGVGYCLSMILTFLVGALLFVNFLKKLTYNIFITNIVKRQNPKKVYVQRIGSESKKTFEAKNRLE